MGGAGWCGRGVLLLGGVLTLGQEGPDPFASVLPSAVGDVSGWEVVSGEFETPRARGAYRFRVDPRRQAVYSLIRYRVELLTPTGETERMRGLAERVVFNRRPGSREPLECWEREPAGAAPGWRIVPPGTDEYRLEMAIVMQVLAVHRNVRTGR